MGITQFRNYAFVALVASALTAGTIWQVRPDRIPDSRPAISESELQDVFQKAVDELEASLNKGGAQAEAPASQTATFLSAASPPEIIQTFGSSFFPDVSTCAFVNNDGHHARISTLADLASRFSPSENRPLQSSVDNNLVKVYALAGDKLGAVTGVKIATDYVLTVGHIAEGIKLGSLMHWFPEDLQRMIPNFSDLLGLELDPYAAKTSYAVDFGGTLYAVDRILFDAEGDVALIHIKGLGSSAPAEGIYFRDSSTLNVGDAVTVSGFHYTGPAFKEDGVVTGVHDDVATAHRAWLERNRIVTSIKPFGGLSGSPITDSSGAISALVSNPDVPQNSPNRSENYRGSLDARIERLAPLLDAEKYILSCYAGNP